jgi:hypothetical protein
MYWEWNRNKVIHFAVRLTTGPQSLPQRILHRGHSSAFSFNLHYPFVSLRSSSGYLRFLPRLSVTSILPSTFPSMTCFKMQFLRKLRPIHLDLRLFIYVGCRIFVFCLTIWTLLHFSHERSNWSSPSFSSSIFQNFLNISVLVSEVSKAAR